MTKTGPQVAVAVAMAAMEVMVEDLVVAVAAEADKEVMEVMAGMDETKEIMVAEAVEPEVFLQMVDKAGQLIVEVVLVKAEELVEAEEGAVRIAVMLDTPEAPVPLAIVYWFGKRLRLHVV